MVLNHARMPIPPRRQGRKISAECMPPHAPCFRTLSLSYLSSFCNQEHALHRKQPLSLTNVYIIGIILSVFHNKIYCMRGYMNEFNVSQLIWPLVVILGIIAFSIVGTLWALRTRHPNPHPIHPGPATSGSPGSLHPERAAAVREPVRISVAIQDIRPDRGRRRQWSGGSKLPPAAASRTSPRFVLPRGPAQCELSGRDPA